MPDSKDQRLFKDIISSSPNGIIVTDQKNRIKLMNRSVEVFWGIDSDSAINKKLEDVIPEFKIMDKLDERIFKIDINDKYYYVLPFQMDADNGEKDTVYLILDIYENKLLRSELSYQKEMTRELEEILEGSFDGILVTDADGKILYVNSSYERVAEIKKKDMEGKTMKDLINPVWMPNSVAYIVAEQKQPVSKRQTVKSGRHIIVTGRPVFNKKGDIKKIVINARDITEIYELTEELQRSREMGKMYLENYSELAGYMENKGKNPILAASQEMRSVLSLAEKVANFHATVLILGESGVGKEEVAKYIHNNSLRSEKPFIVLNCGAIPANLLESELFGYEKGAFTGAMQSGKEGLLEAADGGTVFLDEIGETPLDFQVKLLRFLESKEVRRVGALEARNIDVRIIAATNRDLALMVEEGTFREDLYYRLNVVQIDVPPLRKRVDDIMPLASLFLHRYNELYNQEKLLTYEVTKELEKYPWVGNVRQLKNVIENMVIVSNNDYLQTEDLPWVTQEMRSPSQKMVGTVLESSENLSLNEATEALEKLMFQRAKETCNTTREIADKLKVNQSTVVRKLQKYGL
ncbi:sigma 54-interacting transcriptional regulator [Clostridiales Family XIII bacterium ASD5510]|uniref:HTH-type transcriptional regulatory protein TyrR n=1 Tax=Hominibacterium faecale TaxID=2839743 RepID=A0A9J6QMV5_9FIRM|nr:sigma 54-interacting transcriptional regulator [Hominibacterium faecale]MCU7377266.1 sigma 54-interacting transcriptional regulator [Hominibacterium faecale]